MKVEIAFNLAANGIGDYFTLDDATKGKLDDATYTLAGDVLVDVTSDVRAVQVKRGRSKVLDKFTAGNANVTLDNRDRYFDPTYAPTIATRTNLVTNPSFEVDTAPWSLTTNCTVSRVTTDAYFGSASLQMVLGASFAYGYVVNTSATRPAVTGGQSYTFSFYVKATSGTPICRATVNWYTSGGAYISQNTGTSSTTTTSWERRSVTATAPASAAFAELTLECPSSASTNTVLFDGIMFEQSSTLNPYFDGTNKDSTIRTVTQAWNGTANASTSTITYYVDGTGSPYYGSIVPRKQVRISHLGYDLFTGMVEDWNLSYDVSGDSIAEPSCVDGFSILAQQVLTPGTATSQATGARVGAVLDATGWPTTQRSISTGAATLDADVVGDDVNALAYLQKVELSEGPAALFVDKSGDFTFRDRSYMQTGTSAVTFGTGGIPFIDIAVQYGTETMVNSATVTWSNGTAAPGTAVANDLTAQAAYGVMDVAYDTLLDTSADAQALADWIVAKYAQPSYEVDSITVSMDGLSSSQRAQVLALELGDVVSVTWTPNDVGTAITQTLNVDSIEHRATPARHDVTFTMSPTLAAFILDSATFGVLDTSILAL